MSAAPGPGRADRRRPGLPTIVARAVADDRVWSRGDLVLAAVSGGPDSTALLHVLARTRARLGFRVAACGVDHGLRPAAAAELALAAGLAATLEVPFDIVRVTVAPGGNLQARARAERHAALREVAGRVGAAVIATGHTADDRAETVLSRLLRGAGPRGLAVLPPRDGPLARPLIRAFRRDVAAYVERHGLPCSTDPSNLDARFERVRIRRELLPLMASMAPRVVSSLCDLADALAEVRATPDPLAGFNAAQRRAIAAARARGRTHATLLVAGGRHVDVDLQTLHVGAGVGPSADPTTGGSRASHGDAVSPAAASGPENKENSHSVAFPAETAVLIQESAAARRGRRRL